jgi:uncharacterized membrane protein
MTISVGENPHWVFVGFLNSWVAVEIAKQFCEASDDEFKNRRVRIFSHLVLAMLVVVTSWIAWTVAFLNGDSKAPTEVVSAQTLMVIFDIAIVTVYFNFIRIVGNMRRSKESFPQYKQQHASFWVALILTMYVAWDILAWSIAGDPSNMNLDNPTEKYSFWLYSWATPSCATLAWLVFYLQINGTIRRLVESDISLIFLLLLFRTLKQMSHTIEPTPILRQIWPQTGSRKLTLFASAFLVTFLGFAWLAGRYKDKGQSTAASG